MHCHNITVILFHSLRPALYIEGCLGFQVIVCDAVDGIAAERDTAPLGRRVGRLRASSVETVDGHTAHGAVGCGGNSTATGAADNALGTGSRWAYGGGAMVSCR